MGSQSVSLDEQFYLALSSFHVSNDCLCSFLDVVKGTAKMKISAPASAASNNSGGAGDEVEDPKGHAAVESGKAEKKKSAEAPADTVTK